MGGLLWLVEGFKERREGEEQTILVDFKWEILSCAFFVDVESLFDLVWIQED